MATLEDYKRFMAEVSKLTDLPAMASDDDGLVSVRVEEEYIVSLQFIEASQKVLCFIEVTDLPEDTPAEVYRDILAGSLFGRETGGGYFAMDRDTNTLIYNYLFDFGVIAANPAEFVESLETILQNVEVWAVRIGAGISGESGDVSAKQEDDVFIQP